MINDDFNFTLDSSDFPVSIEEFAAYMDGNLSDDEMQRVSSVIAHDDSMQEIMDDMEQSELTLADYGQDEMQLPEEIADGVFDVPETVSHYAGGGGFFNPFASVAACAAAPLAFDYFNDSVDAIEGNDCETISDLDDNASSLHTEIMGDSTNDNPIAKFSNDVDMNISNDETSLGNGVIDDIYIE